MYRCWGSEALSPMMSDVKSVELMRLLDVVMGWTVSPPKEILDSWCHYSKAGDRVLTEVIKLKRGHWGGPESSMALILFKRRNLKGMHSGRTLYKGEVVWPQTKQLPAAGRGLNRPCPSTCRGSVSLPPDVCSPELRRNTFLLFKTLSLWHFVTAARANRCQEENQQLMFSEHIPSVILSLLQ